METKLVSDFSSIHGVRKILLVGEHQEQSVAKLILVQHALQLLAGFGHTLAIVGVDNEDNALGVLEVWGVADQLLPRLGVTR